MPCGILATPLTRSGCCGPTPGTRAGATRPPTAGSCCTGRKSATSGEGAQSPPGEPQACLSSTFSWDSLATRVLWTGTTGLHLPAHGSHAASACPSPRRRSAAWARPPFPAPHSAPCKTRCLWEPPKPRPVCREARDIQPLHHYRSEPASRHLTWKGLSLTEAHSKPRTPSSGNRAEASRFALAAALHRLLGGMTGGRGSGQEPRVRALGLVPL